VPKHISYFHLINVNIHHIIDKEMKTQYISFSPQKLSRYAYCNSCRHEVVGTAGSFGCVPLTIKSGTSLDGKLGTSETAQARADALSRLEAHTRNRRNRRAGAVGGRYGHARSAVG
jgi:hypothetical protein